MKMTALFRRNIVVLSISIWLVCLACNENIEGKFTATGIVEGTAVQVAAQTGGLILHMPIEEGEHVEIDQTVAVIDTEKIVFQRDQIVAGLQEVEAQRSIALASLAKAEADFDNIETKFQRFKKLLRENSTAQQTVDDLETALEVATAQRENARQSLNVIDSKHKQLDAQRKLIERQISDATVTAPIAGTITAKYFEAGETASPGLPVIEIINLQKMWTKIYVSEMLLPKIALGNEVSIHVDGSGEELNGTVSWINSKAEFTPKNILTEENRTSLVYAVKILIENPDGILKHGMPVEVTVPIE